eukprot:Sdes_comp15677_c0_seq1m4700
MHISEMSDFWCMDDKFMSIKSSTAVVFFWFGFLFDPKSLKVCRTGSVEISIGESLLKFGFKDFFRKQSLNFCKKNRPNERRERVPSNNPIILLEYCQRLVFSQEYEHDRQFQVPVEVHQRPFVSLAKRILFVKKIP